MLRNGPDSDNEMLTSKNFQIFLCGFWWIAQPMPNSA